MISSFYGWLNKEGTNSFIFLNVSNETLMKLIHAFLTRTCLVYESDFIILAGNYGFINLIWFFFFKSGKFHHNDNDAG